MKVKESARKRWSLVPIKHQSPISLDQDDI